MKKGTPAQLTAINSNDPTILCLAGPGSGKTTVLISRIARLMNWGIDETSPERPNVDPKKIVALTFTNASARELEDRLNASWVAGENLGPIGARSPLGYVGTLHGFALKMLKQHGGGIGYGERMSIISPESAATLLESKAKQIGCKTKLADLMKWKQKGIPATQISDGIHPPQRLRLCKEDLAVLAYYDELREAGIVDFDVMLEEFHRLIWAVDLKGIFTHLFVDEVQDSGRLDWKIYKGLPIANKFLVGDPDQAIYSFRGGEVDQVLKFAKEIGVTVIALEANFRSHEEICYSAQKLIAHNVDRFPKITFSIKGYGGAIYAYPEYFNEGEEIARVVRAIQVIRHDDGKLSEIAILTRQNALAREFTKALVAADIPVVQDERSDLPKDWPATRALIELMAQPHNDTLAFFYIVANKINKGMAPAEAFAFAHTTRTQAAKAGMSINDFLLFIPTPLKWEDVTGQLFLHQHTLESTMIVVEIARELPAGQREISDLALALGQTRERKEKPLEDTGVTVSTIHGAKGREWDTVFIAGLEDEITPGSRKNTNVEEERRLCYVAVTRARKVLHLLWSSSRLASWGAVVDHTPSRFIKEMLP